MNSIKTPYWTSIALGCTLVVSMLAIGCSRDDSAPAASTPAVPAVPATQQQTAQSEDYPLDVCVVSGEKLGAMGDPIVITHEGREVRFCCAGCVPKFRAEPAKYLAKLEAAAKGESADEHADHDH